MDDAGLRFPNKLKQRELTSVYIARLQKALAEIGWVASALQKRALDKNGMPCPWYTYSALHFIEPRVRPNWRVFEYGGGQSTIWWASRVSQVIAVDNNQEWVDFIGAQAPGNASIIYRPVDESGVYAREVLAHEGQFDLIVVDGRDRVNSAINCLSKLKDDGVIIWDNSNRRRYQPGFDHLETNGFKRLDFWGLGPVETGMWMTSVFYRSHNVMGI